MTHRKSTPHDFHGERQDTNATAERWGLSVERDPEERRSGAEMGSKSSPLWEMMLGLCGQMAWVQNVLLALGSYVIPTGKGDCSGAERKSN